jgi:hypothetical protein
MAATDNKQAIINSITKDINEFFESKNNTFTKKEFSDFILSSAKNSYDTCYSKKGAKRRAKKTSSNDENGEEKPKKALSEYQLFMKEQMKILKESGDERKPNDLMKEVGKMWKAKKEEAAK